MKEIHSIDQIDAHPPLVVTVGNFDGVHTGHRSILNHLSQLGDSLQAQKMVITFEKNPKKSSTDGNNNLQLMTKMEKKQIFQQLNINLMWTLDFEQVKHMTYTEFLDLLAAKTNLKAFVMTKKLCIGYQRQGTADKIIHYLKRQYPYVKVCLLSSIVYLKKRPLSSTVIRHLLEQGKVQKAISLLQTPYRIRGIVVPGKQLGRKIGFPTLNIKYPPEKVRLPDGVYATRTHLHTHVYDSLTFVGVSFTEGNFIRKNSEKNILIETYLLNCSKTVYNKWIIIEFLCFMRRRKEFKNIEELKKTLIQDKKKGLQLHQDTSH